MPPIVFTVRWKNISAIYTLFDELLRVDLWISLFNHERSEFYLQPRRSALLKMIRGL